MGEYYHYPCSYQHFIIKCKHCYSVFLVVIGYLKGLLIPLYPTSITHFIINFTLCCTVILFVKRYLKGPLTPLYPPKKTIYDCAYKSPHFLNFLSTNLSVFLHKKCHESHFFHFFSNSGYNIEHFV